MYSSRRAACSSDPGFHDGRFVVGFSGDGDEAFFLEPLAGARDAAGETEAFVIRHHEVR